MRSILYYTLLLFSICIMANVHGQAKAGVAKKHKTVTRKDQPAKAYARAIAEYIKATYGKSGTPPDTLFIGKNADMPDITLPANIEGIPTLLITDERAQKKLSYRKSLVYLNVVGWIDPDKWEFIIVTFFEFKPQHNCSIHFSRNATSGQMELANLEFQYTYDRQK